MTPSLAKPAETAGEQGVGQGQGRGEASLRPALVVFCDQTGVWWLRALRRGFRHCFVMVRVDGGWVLYNPLSNGTQIELWPDFTAEVLQAWLAAQGFHSVPARAQAVSGRPWPWRPFTCVEAVKRALGLKAPWALTPWQLYGVLRKMTV